MNRTTIIFLQRLNTVNWISNNVEYTTFDSFTNRHFDRSTSVNYLHATNQTFGSIHCNCTNSFLT
ncbi:Uncharacterised protein [Mycobacterium tuberculosis]|nr:Uncharacterised protein [Mycobacterium tuberculosis]